MVFETGAQGRRALGHLLMAQPPLRRGGEQCLVRTLHQKHRPK